VKSLSWQKRTFHLLRKADISICYGHAIGLYAEFFEGPAGAVCDIFAPAGPAGAVCDVLAPACLSKLERASDEDPPADDDDLPDILAVRSATAFQMTRIRRQLRAALASETVLGLADGGVAGFGLFRASMT